MRWAVPLILSLVLAACGGSSPPDQETTTFVPDQEATEKAGEYALNLSGGEMNGCSTAAPGRESEEDPGCIYGVAFSGCYWGITGDQLGPQSIEEEFPKEPKLVELYYQAHDDCS